jgi:hypothetical protein
MAAGAPVLVLSGELDSITTPAEGRMVTEQFPRARQVVVPVRREAHDRPDDRR